MQAQTYDVAGPLRVTVTNAAGDVRVTATDAVRAEVEVTPLRDDEASRDAAERTTVDLRGDELRVEVPGRGRVFFGRDPQVRVDVRVPAESTVRFATASADVHAAGRLGEVHGKTASGDVTIEAAAEVRVDTASGDLRVDDVRGGAGLRAASGGITVGHVGGPLDASVVSGDLRVGSAARGGRVHAVSGDIDVRAVAQGDMDVKSVSGDVTVGVPQGTRVHVDVSTVSGDLSSDVPLDDSASAADGEGPLVAITGRTVSGDLHVRRA